MKTARKTAALLGGAGLIALAAAGCGQRAGQGGWALPAAQQQRIDAVFSDFNQRTPGCVLGVVENGELAYARGYGMANLEEGVRLTPQSVLEVGSVSKQFTAASIFLLQQEGKLSLDDDIRKYIPEMPRYAQPVTIRELLHHTSGVRDVIELMKDSGIPYQDFATQADALAMIERQQELNFAPNSEYRYSNSGYVLLAEIVKRVSGEPLAQFAAQRIFRPLGMTHTQILDDYARIVPGRAQSYQPRPGGGYEINVSNWEQTGDGAVNTTVGDLALWARNFEHPVVGGVGLIRALETQGVLNDGEKIGYAAGLDVDTYRGLRRVSHIGAWQGYRARFALYPGAGLGLITLCNTTNANVARTTRVADILLAGKLAPVSKLRAAPLPAAQLGDMTGLYWSEARHELRRVQMKQGRLYLTSQDSAPEAMTPVMGGGFAVAGGSAQFQADGAHQELQLRFGPESLEQTGAETLVREASDPSPEMAPTLAGRYRCAAMQVSWQVTADAHGLELHTFGANPNRLDTDHTYALKPALKQVYTAGPYLLEFDAHGFRLYVGGARGMRFARE